MYSEATSWVYDLCIEGTMMICFEGNGARIPLRSRDLTICIRKATRENYPKGCMCEKSVSIQICYLANYE